MLVNEIVELLIEATDDVVLGNSARLAVELKHGGLCVLVEVPREDDEHVLHRLPCNYLEPMAPASLVNLLDVDSLVEIDGGLNPLMRHRRIVEWLG